MGRESCNLNKDEAEIMKPTSTSSPPSPPQQPASPPASSTTNASPPSLFIKKQIQRSEPAVHQTNSTSNSHKRKLAEPSPEQPGGRDIISLPNRCSSCRKKVGLIGFRCRCGDLFCSRHRYSESHVCSFDYKAAGREEIAKANPVIRAAKIIKI